MDNLALATAGDLVASADETWNQLYLHWLRYQALTRANEKFGPLGKAVYEDQIADADLTAQFGKGWRSIPEAMNAYQPFYAKLADEEENISRDYYQPQSSAAIALALHPAPNLAAAMLKIEVIEREELHNYLPMPRDPWEIVAEDFARLQKKA